MNSVNVAVAKHTMQFMGKNRSVGAGKNQNTT